MRTASAAFLAAILASPSLADVTLPAVFTDHMVLQRDRPVRIYGMAQPNEEVSVELRDSTQLHSWPLCPRLRTPWQAHLGPGRRRVCSPPSRQP
jgi:sialate O-acetylesterase